MATVALLVAISAVVQNSHGSKNGKELILETFKELYHIFMTHEMPDSNINVFFQS